MYNPVPIRFYDTAAHAIGFFHDRVEEPVSGTTNGTTLTLTYTPRIAGQIIRGGQLSGPLSRCRVEASTDGGSVWTNVTTGITLPGSPGAGSPYTVLVRGVAIPFAGDNSEVSSFAVVVTESAGQADWLA
jgi:hypothetical protein